MEREVGIAQQLIKTYCFKQQVNAGAAVGMQILQEGVAKASGSTGPRNVLAVVAEM